MVPPVLIMATLGSSGFCSGSGDGSKAGFAPLPIFSIFVFGVICMPML